MIGVDPFASGVLDKEKHQRLVAKLDDYCRIAGVPKKVVWTDPSHACSTDEIGWLRSFRRRCLEGRAGLCYVGKFKGSLVERYQLLVGWMMRNYVDARILSSAEMFQYAHENDRPTATALFLPGFFAGGEQSKMPGWVVGNLLAILQERHAREQLTVLHVADMQKLRVQWGAEFAEWLDYAFDELTED